MRETTGTVIRRALVPTLVIGATASWLVVGWPATLVAASFLGLSAVLLLAVLVLRGAMRGISLTGAFTFLSLFIAEGVAVTREQLRVEPPTLLDPDPFDSSTKYYRADSVLGYSLNPHLSVRAARHDRIGVVYDVTYHSDANGLRITPASRDDGPVIAFFGCSWTYGEGVEDGETLPNQFALASGGTYQVLNLALYGYGPHQMLRAIETGRYDSLLRRAPAAFIYLAAPWQIPRSAGKNAWDPGGPRYVLNDDRLQWTGQFWDFPDRQRELLMRSALGRLINDAFLVTSEDVALFVGIIRQSHEELLRRFGVGLTVLYVQDAESDQALARVGWSDDSIQASLHHGGVNVIDGRTPAGSENENLYHLRSDGHPTALANRARADSLIRHVIIAPRVPRTPNVPGALPKGS